MREIIGTVIVAAILVLIVVLIIRSMIKNKDIGGCGGDCSRCKGHCSH